MAEPILMPRLTIDMEKGTVLEWHKEEGDAVEQGDIVAVVFGDKVEWEVEAPASGTLIKVLVAPDEEVEVAKPIGWVGEPGEDVPQEAPAAPAPVASESDAAPAQAASLAPAGAVKTEDGAPPAGKPKASPAAKRIAREKGIDLTRVKGTGPGGRIVEADVAALVGEPPVEAVKAAPPGAITLTPLRKTIAERMQRSWTSVPHFTVATEVDMHAALDFREEARGPNGAPFTVNDLVVAAVGKALADSEPMQRRWDGEHLCAHAGSGLGVAVHTEGGLVVPVVEGVAEKSLADLTLEIKTKAERARTGRLKPEDLRPAAMTVTNLGMFGITRFHAVINHPECAILAVGILEERPVALEGKVAIRPRMALDLAVDHRAIDGGTAATFLARVKSILEGAAFD
ncbi:MAG: dihydrolipoamide acetyltransferase family protein [Planctomycetota bacterium]|jgi:pyruvate dehydrogenase E2 component (dihydrolipoamide acetyltransferase)